MKSSAEPKYVRYQAMNPNSRGTYPGIFALANGLANGGTLTDEEWASWRLANERYQAAYADPTSVDSTIYDCDKNPTAQSWFKSTATHLLVDLPFYTDLLDRHGVDGASVDHLAFSGFRVCQASDHGHPLGGAERVQPGATEVP